MSRSRRHHPAASCLTYEAGQRRRRMRPAVRRERHTVKRLLAAGHYEVVTDEVTPMTQFAIGDGRYWFGWLAFDEDFKDTYIKSLRK